MADVIPLLGKEDQQVLVNKVIARGRPAVGWCLQRAVAYYEKFPDSLYQDQDAAAALDYLRWLGPGCD